jgi:metallophosphoesterase (TIGR00282 family)
MIIINGENAAGGFGLTPEDSDRFFSVGVDVITSGNHIWQKREILPLLDSEDRLLRPANYPPGVPGHGYCIVEKKGTKVAVINLLGRSRMGFSGECPFATGKKIIQQIGSKADYFLIDFHAEDPMEKEALVYYLDGVASLVYGTHTHIQTADERILPGGTGYITDIGMVGPDYSVIGSDPEQSIKRSISQLPIKMEVIDNTPLICGIVVDLKDGGTSAIQRIRIKGI